VRAGGGGLEDRRSKRKWKIENERKSEDEASLFEG
jgi:hypothetical protein